MDEDDISKMKGMTIKEEDKEEDDEEDKEEDDQEEYDEEDEVEASSVTPSASRCDRFIVDVIAKRRRTVPTSSSSS